MAQTRELVVVVAAVVVDPVADVADGRFATAAAGSDGSGVYANARVTLDGAGTGGCGSAGVLTVACFPSHPLPLA